MCLSEFCRNNALVAGTLRLTRGGIWVTIQKSRYDEEGSTKCSYGFSYWHVTDLWVHWVKELGYSIRIVLVPFSQANEETQLAGAA